jgi:hypothetical protein
MPTLIISVMSLDLFPFSFSAAPDSISSLILLTFCLSDICRRRPRSELEKCFCPWPMDGRTDGRTNFKSLSDK